MREHKKCRSTHQLVYDLKGVFVRQKCLLILVRFRPRNEQHQARAATTWISRSLRKLMVKTAFPVCMVTKTASWSDAAKVFAEYIQKEKLYSKTIRSEKAKSEPKKIRTAAKTYSEHAQHKAFSIT